MLQVARQRVELILQPEVYDIGASLKALSDDTAWEYEHRTVIELIQNGHDALEPADPGRIVLLLDLDTEQPALYAANQGRPFTFENFKAISQLATSNKNPGEGIGNKGLGFRSVLELTDYPEIYSKLTTASTSFDGYSFRSAKDDDLLDLIDDEFSRRIVRERNHPLLLPLPAEQSDPTLEEFIRGDFSTVVKLPLRDAAAAESAAAQLREVVEAEAPLLLFLDRIARLDVEIREADRAPTRTELTRLVEHRTLEGGADCAAHTVDLGRHGRFLVFRRAIDALELHEAIARSVQARQVGERWLNASQGPAEVGVALRLDRDVEAGRAYTYLPMGPSAASPMHGHVHAPFFTKLARLAFSPDVALNDFLLDQLASACLEFALLVKDHLPFKQAAPRVLDLLSWSEEPARLRKADPGILDLSLAPLVGERWGRFGAAYAWPATRTWAALTPTALTEAGALILDPRALAGRSQRIEPVRRSLSGRGMQPPSATVAEWAEHVARRMAEQPGTLDGSAWSGFYDDLAHEFRSNAQLLCGRLLVIDQNGTLVPTQDPDSTRRIAFFAPEGESRGSISDLGLMQEWFCFTHPAVPWSLLTKLFFQMGGLIQDFTPGHVLAHIKGILDTEQPDEVHASALAYASRLALGPAAAAERSTLAEIAFRVPTATLGWIAAKEAFLSPGWDSRVAQLTGELIADGGGTASDIRHMQTHWLLGPEDWPFPVRERDRFRRFLRTIGVRDALPIGSTRGYSSQAADIDPKAIATEAGLDESLADAWIAAVHAAGRSWYLPDYAFAGQVKYLTGAASVEAMEPSSRARYAELILRALSDWGQSSLTVSVYQPNKRRPDWQTWPTPLATYLRTRRWLPYEESGATGFAAPSEIWYADHELPEYIRTLSSNIRTLAGQEKTAQLLADLGLLSWDNPHHSGARLKALGFALHENQVPQHLFAEFRRLYVKALADAAKTGTWAWHPSDRATVAVDTHIGLRSHMLNDDEPVYIEDVPSPLERSLLIAAQLPVLLSHGGTADASSVAKWVEKHSDSVIRISKTPVRVFDGPEPVEANPDQRPLGEEYPWLPAVVTMVLELKGHIRDGLNGERRRDQAALIGAIRVIRTVHLRLEVGDRAVPTTALPRALALPDADCPSIVTHVSPGDSELEACAPALARLAGYPSASDGLQLVLYKLQQLLKVTGRDKPTDRDLAAAMEERLERVTELRDEVTGDVARLADLLRPVLALHRGIDAIEEIDADLNAAASVADLEQIVQAAAGDYLLEPTKALAALRLCTTPADTCTALALDLRSFNLVLAALGTAPVTYPTEHKRAFETFLRLHGRALEARIREHFHALATTGLDISTYESCSRLDGLEPDPAWLELYVEPPQEVLHAHAVDWLNGLGADPDLYAPPRLDSEAIVRDRNNDRLTALFAPLTAYVRHWCDTHAMPMPSAWAHAQYRAWPILDALPEAGLLDLEPAILVEVVSRNLGWPEGLPFPSEQALREQPPITVPTPSAESTAASEPALPNPITPSRHNIVQIGGVAIDALDSAAVRRAARGSVSEQFLSQTSPIALPAADRTVYSGGLSSAGVYIAAPKVSEEQRSAIGLAGEVIAAAWLEREFPGAHICWVSGYAAREGRPDASDAHGYDYIVEWRGMTYYIEVKAFAESRDAVDVALGESEVRAATEHTSDDGYKVLIISGVKSPEGARFAALMPNPLTPAGAEVAELVGHGLRYRYRFGAGMGD
ncbi:hypothetical protein KDK95_09990 [Actinospica sp. MGRD01-02]|uniref:Sacsin/Nov domain-containing protein n=1 Tax=Actinospica acidithermotolerans TaxID=2828514 RepID=A0A941IFR5_9ACTN|nr:hypothetical protein [Actinospica acidithermotolerans]MBR7826635.1 hypothetical protein [Actinospica acidithermotolerans]